MGAAVKVTIQGGNSYDLASPAEVRQIVSEQQQAAARGITWMRIPTGLQGKPSGSAITLGITQGQPPTGPDLGYIWSVRRLTVTGLTRSATAPDIVNLYLNDNFNGPVLWQFNGNNFGYSFGLGELIINSGETLALQNSGTIAATGTITLSGEVWQVPSERQYELMGR